jgi:uncharacterized protein YktB (UPF0637 family)
MSQEVTMAFQGFTEREFDIFDLQGFAVRMPAIRAEVTPRLKALGEQIAPALPELTHRELHPHVAQHLRRTVNPPVETWVAFSPSPRAYKPYIHFRVAINGGGLKVVCHLEEDSEDKPAFAEGLKRNAAAVARHLAAYPGIRSGDERGKEAMQAGEARFGASGSERQRRGPGPGPRPWSEAELATLGERLSRVKAQDASFAILFDRGNPVVASPAALLEAALDAMRTLLPIYRLGAEPGVVLDGAGR